MLLKFKNELVSTKQINTSAHLQSVKVIICSKKGPEIRSSEVTYNNGVHLGQRNINVK